ncbi:unnamed protein product, partial [Urochloa humidicola]
PPNSAESTIFLSPSALSSFSPSHADVLSRYQSTSGLRRRCARRRDGARLSPGGATTAAALRHGEQRRRGSQPTSEARRDSPPPDPASAACWRVEKRRRRGSASAVEGGGSACPCGDGAAKRARQVSGGRARETGGGLANPVRPRRHPAPPPLRRCRRPAHGGANTAAPGTATWASSRLSTSLSAARPRRQPPPTKVAGAARAPRRTPGLRRPLAPVAAGLPLPASRRAPSSAVPISRRPAAVQRLRPPRSPLNWCP